MITTLAGVALASLIHTGPALAGGAPAVETSAEPTAGYRKGFFINGGDFGVKIQGRVQGRYTFESVDKGDKREAESAFAVQRARLKMSGHAFGKDIKYKLQIDLGKGSVALKDFVVERRLGSGDAWLRVGQSKRPFSRQQINSSGKLELVDRSITDKAFGGGRDIGLALHNGYERSPEVEWAVGVYNGTGDKPRLSGHVLVDPVTGEGKITDGKLGNVPHRFEPAIVARFGYNHGGVRGYSEADLEGGPLRWGAGASAYADLDADDDNHSVVRGEIDYVIKAAGFSTTGGVYGSADQDGGRWTDRTSPTLGFHVQAGYVLDKKYEPVVRYALVDPQGRDNNLREISGGLSIYSFGHGFKWQTDVAALATETATDPSNDIRVRTQLQLAF